MPKTPIEKGSARTVTLVPGVEDFPKWRGIKREGSPATIPSNQLWLGQNIRLSGGRLVSRGGQSKVNPVPTDGCIEGFWPVDPDPWTGRQYDMWLFNTGNYETPAEMYSFDGTTLTQLTQDRVGRGRYLFGDEDGLYAAAGGGTNPYAPGELRQITPDGAGDITQEVLLSYTTSGPGDQSLITTIARFDDLLFFFMATSSPETIGGIYSYDGVTATRELELLSSGASTAPFVIVGSEMLWPNASNLRRRDLNGTWDTVSLPAGGSLTITRPYSGAEYNGAGYFVGTGPSGTTIFKYESGSVTTSHALPAGAAAETGLGGFSTFGSDLYLAYRASGGIATIAKFDGATWTDSVSTFASGGQTNALKENTAESRLYALRDTSFDYTTDGVNWTNISTAISNLRFMAFY